ncbi:hypothetical protein SEVIR_2G044700v4 [Setaria viridis]|uniref:3-oxo-5-alpha-steroid 4-dehydrogenase C-terminal domain-containing protein n=1 Tax=Setaria viridis TaxID=4556 RepID=A0A4U6VQ07_SETVI|nr:3-oxo-5-alpha-steroid 4-dehydrogenase 1-like [Setaria viridis]TKW30533.1 hypothetical protein SEVIR_2G044700v2 [Setaria viridis]
MMWPSLPPPFLYPPSAFVAAASLVTVVSLASLGLAELRGEHVAYSKFWGPQRPGGGGALLPSRAGMLVGYVPALVAALASFAVPGAANDGARAQLLRAALAVHFLKRVLEVLFVHRYSGSMPLPTVLQISSCYLLYVIMFIYAQHLSRGLPEPAVDTLHLGALVFAIGVAGNFYHHHLLSRLRTDGGGGAAGGDRGYKIPRGGLFELVACPHYLFEIVVFAGLAMIAQTAFALALAVGTAAFLACRSCATRRWYAAKFEEFPAGIRALVPYVL